MVLVGEVWLASGQSNMVFPVQASGPYGGVLNFEGEVAAAKYPQIRMFTARDTKAREPQTNRSRLVGSMQPGHRRLVLRRLATSLPVICSSKLKCRSASYAPHPAPVARGVDLARVADGRPPDQVHMIDGLDKSYAVYYGDGGAVAGNPGGGSAFSAPRPSISRAGRVGGTG